MLDIHTTVITPTAMHFPWYRGWEALKYIQHIKISSVFLITIPNN